MARVLVISLSDLRVDARVDRQIGFLRERHEVIAAGFGTPAHDVEFIDLTPPPVPAPRALARRASGLARLAMHRYAHVHASNAGMRFAAQRLASVQPDLVVANDLTALPLGAEIAHGAPIIFDAHEYAPAELARSPWWRLLVAPYTEWVLRTYLPQVSAMTTVSEGIADIYGERFGLRPEVVTNAPARAALEPTPVHDPVRVLHHGIALPDRGLEEMIEAVTALDGRYTLDLRLVPGAPGYLERLAAMTAANPWAHVVEPVPMRELVRSANDYDLGVFLGQSRHINETYALPNKLFEYVQARLAVIVGPAVEMARVVEEYDCGVVSAGFGAPQLTAVLRDLTPERIAACKLGSHRAAEVLNAERNRELVLQLADDALSEPVSDNT